jgi:hypothetical protein
MVCKATGTYEVASEKEMARSSIAPNPCHVPVAMWLGLLLTKDHDQKA